MIKQFWQKENKMKKLMITIFILVLVCLLVSCDLLTNLLNPDDNSLTNVALSAKGATASAISEGTYLGITHHASNAIDGDSVAAWASDWDMPAWLQVEFNATYTIKKVGVWWASHRHDYLIKLSTNGINWTTVKSGTSNNTEGASPVHEEFSIAPQSAKYIKIEITTTTAPSSHIFQAMISEIEAYTSDI